MKSGQGESRTCLRAYKNRLSVLADSVDFTQSNGYVEGMHNKIKTVKRIAFEMHKLYHFQTK
ncbi:MAG: transposase [Peptoniphilaceae bacterium]